MTSQERLAAAGSTAAQMLDAMDDPDTLKRYDLAGATLRQLALRLQERGVPVKLIAAQLLALVNGIIFEGLGIE